MEATQIPEVLMPPEVPGEAVKPATPPTLDEQRSALAAAEQAEALACFHAVNAECKRRGFAVGFVMRPQEIAPGLYMDAPVGWKPVRV